MKYFTIFDRNVATIFYLQRKIGNISDMFLQYSVLYGHYFCHLILQHSGHTWSFGSVYALESWDPMSKMIVSFSHIRIYTSEYFITSIFDIWFEENRKHFSEELEIEDLNIEKRKSIELLFMNDICHYNPLQKIYLNELSIFEL